EHTHQRSVFGQQHLAAAHHAAARQEDAERAAGAVGGVEAALLARVPVELDRGGALEQHGCEAAALGDELVDGQHGCSYNYRYNFDVKAAMNALKLTQIGTSVGLILPKEVLARLKPEQGDTVPVTA